MLAPSGRSLLRLAAFGVALLVLAGCAAPTPPPAESSTGNPRPSATLVPAETSPRVEGRCHRDVCLAESPMDPIAARFNLTKITNDTWDEVNFRVNGRWLVWQVPRDYRGANGSYGGPDADIYLTNLDTHELIPVAADDGFNARTPIVSSEGDVVFQEESNYYGVGYGPWIFTILWDSETRSRTLLDTGMLGSHVPRAFDGKWVVFQVGGSPTDGEDGLWAMNVTDHRLVALYERPLGAEEPEFQPITAAVRDERIFLASYRRNTQYPNPNGYVSTIHLHNGTWENKTFFDSGFGSSARYAMSDRYMAWETGGSTSEIHTVDLDTMLVRTSSNYSEGRARNPSLGSHWLGYYQRYGEHSAHIVINLTSGQRIDVFPRGPGFNMEHSANDDQTFAIRALSLSGTFQYPQHDLYVRALVE